MAISKPLPTFFVVGAAKSGTTTLHYLLNQHPDIYMPSVKETDFFVREHEKGLDWYSDTFYQGADKYKLAGDASPTYLDQSRLVAPRIMQSFPKRDVKFVAIFRDPTDRAYSAYWHNQRNKEEELSFEEAVAREMEFREKGSSDVSGFYSLPLLSGSEYASNLKPFLDLFPSANFLYLFQDDLHDNPQEVMRKLFLFLEVNPDVEIKSGTWNPAALPRWRALNKFILSPSGLLHTVLQPLTHQLSIPARRRLKRYILRKNRNTFSYPPMGAEIEKELRKFFVPEVQMLEKITGRDLSKWRE